MKFLIDNGHGENTLGKCSPDRRLREYKWAREMARIVVCRARQIGLDAELLVPEDYDVTITERVIRANRKCIELGSKNVVLVSIHNNAAGADGAWHDAHGFTVFVSKNASESSKELARSFTNKANSMGLVNPKSLNKDGYWTWSWTKNDIGILKNTKCPAVLTENLFMDNPKDVSFLLSEEGKDKLATLHVSVLEEYDKKHR